MRIIGVDSRRIGVIFVANTFGIYIHIPFCKSKCDYCDFYSLAGQEEQMDRYQRALLTHLRSFGPRMKGWWRIPSTLAGGTPPTMGKNAAGDSLPDSAVVYRQPPGGDHRGVQPRQRGLALHGPVCAAAGSTASPWGCSPRTPSSFGASTASTPPSRWSRRWRTSGRPKINNLSLDLIYGLPGQTMASWEDTLHKAMSLSPEHLSCYGLKVEADTPLAHQVSLGLSLPDGDAQADLYLRAVELLQQGGYRQYEISNFASQAGSPGTT